MQTANSLYNLLKLVDDPDSEVFDIVSKQLLSYGADAIPSLEMVWESTAEPDIQERIELLIHQLHFTDIKTEFANWKNSSQQSIVQGACLVAKIQYPKIDMDAIDHQVQKIKRSVWLELNDFHTPLEQANIIAILLFQHQRFITSKINYDQPNEFFINKMLETKKCNALSLAILFQAVCEELNINARYINFPNQHLIAFYQNDDWMDVTAFLPQHRIQFYVDALTGQAYSQADIEKYLHKTGTPQSAAFYKPLTHCQIINKLLTELSQCFSNTNQAYKKAELSKLSNMLG